MSFCAKRKAEEGEKEMEERETEIKGESVGAGGETEEGGKRGKECRGTETGKEMNRHI